MCKTYLKQYIDITKSVLKYIRNEIIELNEYLISEVELLTYVYDRINNSNFNDQIIIILIKAYIIILCIMEFTISIFLSLI